MIKLTTEEIAFIKQMEEIHSDLGQWTYERLKYANISEIKSRITKVIKNIESI